MFKNKLNFTELAIGDENIETNEKNRNSPNLPETISYNYLLLRGEKSEKKLKMEFGPKQIEFHGTS